LLERLGLVSSETIAEYSSSPEGKISILSSLGIIPDSTGQESDALGLTPSLAALKISPESESEEIPPRNLEDKFEKAKEGGRERKTKRAKKTKRVKKMKKTKKVKRKSRKI